MNSMIKKIKLMIKIIFLCEVDEFVYISMNIDKNLMILWLVTFNCCRVEIV